MLANPDIMINALMRLKEERAARAKAEAERPVAALGKAIETAEGDLTPSAFGKILSNTIKTMGPNKFCRWLLDNKLRIPQRSRQDHPHARRSQPGNTYPHRTHRQGR